MIHNNQIEFMKVFSDTTRHRILDVLTKSPPQNPAELAETLNLTRPGIERHLKVLKDYLLVEREVETWPTVRYVWTITQLGDSFLERLKELLDGYFVENQLEVANRLELLEESFILGKISREQYNGQTKELHMIQDRFAGIIPIQDYLDDALKIREEIESEF
ncbi:MAG: ArsR/SmtB family transcription factor [Candidatus Hodarchaeales archaeon]|jgi:DNA-binding transcriptional ArsR family regulator